MVSNEQIAEIIHILSTHCEPDKIILFGSYAQGTAQEESDLDLAIIVETDIAPFLRPIAFRKAIREGGRRWLFPIDIVVFTSAEMEANQNNQYHLAHEIKLTGKTLYERTRSSKLAA